MIETVLFTEKDSSGYPMEACLSFQTGADYIIAATLSIRLASEWVFQNVLQNELTPTPKTIKYFDANSRCFRSQVIGDQVALFLTNIDSEVKTDIVGAELYLRQSVHYWHNWLHEIFALPNKMIMDELCNFPGFAVEGIPGGKLYEEIRLRHQHHT
jgi:hypothetical protein